jgi:hypothetical protein
MESCGLKCSINDFCTNGTCNCSPGYQGRETNNCQNSCSSHGVCDKILKHNNNNNNNKYQCNCNNGWTGPACDV